MSPLWKIPHDLSSLFLSLLYLIYIFLASFKNLYNFFHFPLLLFLLSTLHISPLQGFHRKQPTWLSLYCFKTFLRYLCFSNLCASFLKNANDLICPTFFCFQPFTLTYISLLSTAISHLSACSPKTPWILSLTIIFPLVPIIFFMFQQPILIHSLQKPRKLFS